MRPLSARKGKALGPHLQSESDERPGVGAESLGRGRRRPTPLGTSSMVKEHHAGIIRASRPYLARLPVTSRMAGVIRDLVPRSRGTG